MTGPTAGHPRAGCASAGWRSRGASPQRRRKVEWAHGIGQDLDFHILPRVTVNAVDRE